MRIGTGEYYNEDCLEGMKRYPDKYFDLALVDPPYGINIEGSGTHFKKFTMKGWDISPPAREYFEQLKRVSKNQVIWGGNYFLDELGNTKCFLIWDKMIGEGMSFADAELAWTSFDKPTRMKRLAKYLGQAGDKILDTHVGSASSLIACCDMGFEFVGFELDKDYYGASVKRINDFLAQGNLFRENPEKFSTPEFSLIQ